MGEVFVLLLLFYTGWEMKQVARWMMSGDKWEETMREKMDDEVGGDDDDVGKLMMWLLLLGPRNR